MKKPKCGVSKNNYDRKLPNGRYSKIHEKLFKKLVSSAPIEGQSFKNTIISEKNACFHALIFYLQLSVTAVTCTVGKNIPLFAIAPYKFDLLNSLRFIFFADWSEFQKTQHKIITYHSLIDLFDQCENAVLARGHDFN